MADYVQCDAMRDVLVNVLLPTLDLFSLVYILYQTSCRLKTLTTIECRRRWNAEIDEALSELVKRTKAVEKKKAALVAAGGHLVPPKTQRLGISSPFACVELRREFANHLPPSTYIKSRDTQHQIYALSLLGFHLTPTLLEHMGRAQFVAHVYNAAGVGFVDRRPIEQALARGLSVLKATDGYDVARLFQDWDFLDFTDPRTLIRVLPVPALALFQLKPVFELSLGFDFVPRDVATSFITAAFTGGHATTVRYVADTWKVHLDLTTLLGILRFVSTAFPHEADLFNELMRLWPLKWENGTQGPVMFRDHILKLPPFPRIECWEQLRQRMLGADGPLLGHLAKLLIAQVRARDPESVGLAHYLHQNGALTTVFVRKSLLPALWSIGPVSRARTGLVPFLSKIGYAAETVLLAVVPPSDAESEDIDDSALLVVE